MEDVDILLFCFALFLSMLIMFLVGSFLRRVKAAKQSDIDKAFICDMCFSKTSFEWKFLEEIVDDLFLDPNEELQAAFSRLFGEEIQHKIIQVIFVEELINAFVEKNLLSVEVSLYTHAVISKNPYFFRTLPVWKRDVCDSLLANVDDPSQEEDLKISRVKKIPHGTPRSKQPKEEKKLLELVPSC